MRILVFDKNPSVLATFASCQDVDVFHGDLSNLDVDAVVSPANSFGFMDGGIDHAYSTLFGWKVQADLQDRLALLPFGELLVGQALILPTGYSRIPWLISAPTMRVPKQIFDANDVMMATRAAISEATAKGLRSLALPGMGTGCGLLPPDVAAAAVACGIANALRPMPPPASWQEAQFRHFHLVSNRSRV